MTSSDEEGFDEKILTELGKQIVYLASPKSFVYHKKVLLRSPRCIYPKVQLFQYPLLIDQIPLSYTLPNNLSHELHAPSPVVFSQLPPVLQLSQFCKKYLCVYNKLGENLLSKHDLTIFIKNVRTAVQADMIRPFQKQFNPAIEKKGKCNLIFESNYEGGNLHSVFMDKNQPNVFYLCLQNDTNTHGFNQWFNFMVKLCPHIQKQFQARFIIINNSKDIKYGPGMCILVGEQTERSFQWSYKNEFLYYKNKYQKYNGQNCNTIDFKIKLTPSLSPLLISLSLPYSYSKLISFLSKIRAKQYQNWDVDIEDIGKSEGSNRLYSVKFIRKNKKNNKNKKCIFILARQHASEAVGSILCEKIMEKILSIQNKESQIHYADWIFVPMANPDGVIHGNSRTNLKGYDINRCWGKINLHLSCQVECISKTIAKVREEYKIESMWDLHGHTKQFNSFGYYSQKNQTSKYYNCLLSEKTQIYNFHKSRFGVGFKKRPTFRGQMFYRERIKNVNTLETSHFGYMKDQKLFPMKLSDFEELAGAFVETLIEVHNLDKEKELRVIQKIQILEKQQKNAIKVQIEETSSKDSDSDPEGDYLLPSQRKHYGLSDQLSLIGNIAGFEDSQRTDSFFKRYEIFEKKEQQEQRPSNRLELRKKKEKNQVRKPIYTSSHVEIIPYQTFYNNQKQNKRYSLDHGSQILDSKKKWTRSKSRRLETNSRQNSTFRKVNGSMMKSRPASVYPTASNVKVNLRGINQEEKVKLRTYKSFNTLLEPRGFNFRDRIKARPPKMVQKSANLQKTLNLSIMNRSLLSLGTKKQ